jgi:hypothetical protein
MYEGQGGEIGLDLLTPDIDGQRLVFSCFIYRRSLSQVGCEAWGRGGLEYSTEKARTNFNTWHTVRIEVDPEIRVTFYVDGQEVGSYKPPDAEQLKGEVFTFQLGVSSPAPFGITANYDDVRVGYRNW